MNWHCTLRSFGSVFSLLAGAFWAEAQGPAIIPLPKTMDVQHGNFVLRAGGQAPEAGTKILANPGTEETGRYLAAELRRRASAECDVSSDATSPGAGNIVLTLQDANPAL